MDELALLLNTIAEKMEIVSVQLDFINPQYSCQNIVQHTIILTKKFTISNFSYELPVMLGYESTILLGLEFHKILAKQSIPLWEIIKTETAKNAIAVTTVHLLFLTSEQQLIPSFCAVSRLQLSDRIIVNSITTVLQDEVPETSVAFNTVNQQSDALLFQKVRDYIVKNLENQLSKIFGVNEFKLKDSFRKYYGTSIYHFFTEERLKKAHILILQTNIPLKEIAFISGYNDYANFYKAFKKRFRYSPSELKRNTIENNL